MQPQSGWKSVRLVKIEGFNYLPDVLPKLFPRITFSDDGLGQTLSPIAAVGFLGYFENEFSHALKSKLPIPERQVQAWRMSAGCPGSRDVKPTVAENTQRSKVLRPFSFPAL